MEKTLAEIAQIIQGEIDGDADISISGLSDLESATTSDLVFAENERWLEQAEQSAAAAIIVPMDMPRRGKTVIRTAKPKLAFGMLMHLFAEQIPYEPGVHPSAVIGEDVEMGAGVSVQPHAVIEAHARIGAGSVIGANAYVGHNVVMGEQCMLHPGVAVYYNTVIGSRVILHAGVVVGSDGFGYVEHDGKRIKIPQIGSVVIEDDVEIGANTTIDRATMGKTVIGAGTKIDNLVQIAHNDRIGKNSIFCAQSGISGSCKLGDNVIVAGQAGLGDHVTVGDNVTIGAQAGIPTGKVIRGNQMVFGAPARPAHETKKLVGAQLRLPHYIEKVKQLEKDMAELKSKLEAVSS